MTKHIMLDLETWGRTPGSDIRSIGAVVFDPTAGVVGETGPRAASFYVACDNPPGRWRNGEFVAELAKNESERLYPLTREPETVKWWSEQSPEAQGAFANPVDMREALDQFTDWIIDLLRNDRHSIAKADFIDGDFDMSGLRVWANDPHFDVSILDAAYRAVQLPTPWHFRSPRSFRTVVELSGITRDDMRQFDTGTAHNALDDAISQAKIVCEAYKRLGLQK